ncbi:hypothetical protein [Methylobacterium sp. Leaf125]|uniref:hypothetical protein n=1 Tax=Methylobacterium sp. Leaf125 TaxID=1736265 RepID=UPI0012E17FF7|nr:hypothetical protein [Methylobacterium sp. Leaf125]
MISTLNNLLGTNTSSAASQAQGAAATAPKNTGGALQKPTSSAIGPATQVDISDRAKTILEQNQSSMTALEKLRSVIGVLKDQVNSADHKISPDADKDQSSSATYPLGMKMLEQVDKYIMKQNTSKDGSISSYNVTVKDISLLPRTQKEIDYWYKNEGADFIAGDFEGSSAEYREMTQAIKDREIEFIDAKEIPDLNYHNKATFQGGEGGSAPGLTRSYNTHSAIFKDPEKGYFPMADGTVISWKKQ